MLETPTQARLRDRFANLDSSTYLVSHSMGAAPIATRRALTDYWDAWSDQGLRHGRPGSPQIGDIADGIGAILGAPRGSVSLAPNVSTLQAAIASSLDFHRKPARGRLRSAAIPLGHLRLEGLGEVRRARRARSLRRGRTVSTERMTAAITERTAVSSSRTRPISRAPSSTCRPSSPVAARSAHCSCSTPIRRRASIRSSDGARTSTSRSAAATNGCAEARAADTSTSSRACG